MPFTTFYNLSSCYGMVDFNVFNNSSIVDPQERMKEIGLEHSVTHEHPNTQAHKWGVFLPSLHYTYTLTLFSSTWMPGCRYCSKIKTSNCDLDVESFYVFIYAIDNLNAHPLRITLNDEMRKKDTVTIGAYVWYVLLGVGYVRPVYK